MSEYINNDGIQESINRIQKHMSNEIPLAMLNFRRRMDAIESKAHIIREKIKDRIT